MATSTSTVRTTPLASGEAVPVLGQGTWHMGEIPARRHDEIAALRLGLDLGLTLIDTAELYGLGASEKLVGEAIGGRRDEVFLVSKVMPQNAARRKAVLACEGSLERLGTDRLDLYLLHWRTEEVRLEETLAAFDELGRAGKIRYWGVSNFDVSDMEELVGLPGGDAVATDQVLYNLTRRGIEWDLMGWCFDRRIPIMAYSPVEQGRLVDHPDLKRVAARHRAAPAEVALAWVLQRDRVIAIPKAGNPKHVRENARALHIRLTEQDLTELDAAFPPPDGPRPLEMI